MPTLETIGGVLGFLVYAFLLYRQNQIMERTNEIMLQQSNKRRTTQVDEKTKWIRSRWPMLVMAALTFATWSGVGYDIYDRHHENVYDPTPQWIDEAGKTFTNEEVLLDGHYYHNCTFVNAKFRYNGTTPIKFIGNRIVGSFLMSTDSKAVFSMAMLLKGLGLLSDQVALTEQGADRIPADVTPLKHQ